MTSRLLEIENEIATHLQAIFDLQTEKQSMLQESDNFTISLQFDDSKRVIRWNGNTIKLGQKTYSLVKLLWNENGHRVTVTKVEQSIWKVGSRKQPFISRHTIKSLVRRAQKQLKEGKFPYKISTVKRHSTREITGYKLICARSTKK
jgi:DNA-binding response OmpR family regulator